MKKRILLFTAASLLGYVTLTSYDNGAALHGQNRTGAKGSGTNCATGGCHGTGSSTTVSIEVDTATTSTAVTSYAPGKLYTIKIHGTNTSSFLKYGFQFASVKGTGSSQTQAGTASAFPTGVVAHTFSSLSFVEHATPLTAATAGVYDISFQWTAPAAGAGNVTLYCTLNAVNGDGVENAADISANTSIVLTEQTGPSSVAQATKNIDITVYPNPATTSLNVVVGGANEETYTMQVFNMTGRMISNEMVTPGGPNHIATISTASWPAGLYQLILQNNSITKMVQVVKR